MWFVQVYPCLKQQFHIFDEKQNKTKKQKQNHRKTTTKKIKTRYNLVKFDVTALHFSHQLLS